MARNHALRLGVLAPFAVLASACVLIRGAPMPIPADQVLAPAPSRTAMTEDPHSAGVGADLLRGRLSAD